jgi:hypothetical protein
MSLSMYQISVPVFVHLLNSLSTFLDKAGKHAEARKIDPTVLVNARLFPDMFALVRQVQICCDSAKGCVARLAGAEVPNWPDAETSFAELQARIARTIEFVQAFPEAQLDGSEDRPIHIKLRSRELNMSGRDYLLTFAQPNFYFHLTAAYAILRHNGVELGKADYLGGV